MAISFLRMSNVSRASGSNSCATLSYITGLKVRDDRTAQTFRFIGKERVRSFNMLLPEGSSFDSPEVLFNSIEMAEKAKNARTAKKIVIALPRECEEQWEQMLEQWIRASLNARGYAAVYAIHTDAENNNPHAHILVPNRPLTAKGTWGKKQTEQFVDAEGNVVDKEHRVPRMRGGRQVTDKQGRKKWLVRSTHHALDQKEILPVFKSEWQAECNKYLEAAKQLDFRSYEEQGRDRIAQVHEGPRARGRKDRGEQSDICERNAAVKLYNAEAANIEQIELELKEASRAETERDRLMRRLQAADNNAYIMFPLDYEAAVQYFEGRRDVIIAETAAERDALQALRAELRTPAETSEQIPERKMREQEADWYGRIANTIRSGFETLRKRLAEVTRRGHQLIRAIAERIRSAGSQTVRSEQDASRGKRISAAAADRRAQSKAAADAAHRSGRIRTAGALRNTFRNCQADERKNTGSVQRDAEIPEFRNDGMTQKMRSSTSYERQEIIRNIENFMNSVPLEPFMQRHGIIPKRRKEKRDGIHLRMPDRREIIISPNGLHWRFAGEYKRGYTGIHEGNARNLAAEFIPDCMAMAAHAQWDEIAVWLGKSECPHLMEFYNQRPVQDTDTRKSLDERIRMLYENSHTDDQMQLPTRVRENDMYRGEER